MTHALQGVGGFSSLGSIQYRRSLGDGSPQVRSRGKAPVGTLGDYMEDVIPRSWRADDVLWISVIRMNIGKRFKAFTIHFILCCAWGTHYLKKFLIGFMKISQVTLVVAGGVSWLSDPFAQLSPSSFIHSKLTYMAANVVYGRTWIEDFDTVVSSEVLTRLNTCL